MLAFATQHSNLLLFFGSRFPVCGVRSSLQTRMSDPRCRISDLGQTDSLPLISISTFGRLVNLSQLRCLLQAKGRRKKKAVRLTFDSFPSSLLAKCKWTMMKIIGSFHNLQLANQPSSCQLICISIFGQTTPSLAPTHTMQ